MLTVEQRDPADIPRWGLTAREEEVVMLVSQGLPNKVIGQRLKIREGTVKGHLHSIYRKLGVSNRTELAIVANKGRRPG